VYYYYYYYYLTAIGLTPCGNRIHLHTNSTQNTENGTHVTITRKKQLMLIVVQLFGAHVVIPLTVVLFLVSVTFCRL
jgi:hypothetical protein